jgi:hypothetical protein
MGVVAIDAFDVHGRRGSHFPGIMNVPVLEHVVPTELEHVGSDVRAGHEPVVTVQAVLFDLREMEESFMAAGAVRPVTGKTSDLRERSPIPPRR